MDTPIPKTWRIVDVLKWSKDYLSSKGVESPQVEAEWMLREILNCTRIDIYLNHDRPLTAENLAAFKKILIERVSGKPLQYVLGYTEFMGLKILVNQHVLIPRPETEVIIEYLRSFLSQNKNSTSRILDVGTGSGCIAISLAVHCSDCEIVAVDISSEGLKIARENARLNHVNDRIQFIKKNILTETLGNRLFNVIVSNPPYVSGEWWENMSESVKNYEPEIALYPGKDPLVFYKRLAELAVSNLEPDGILAVEIGGSYQENDVKSVFAEKGLRDFEVIQDYLGQSRGIVARLNK